jgi:hypothetical protein
MTERSALVELISPHELAASGGIAPALFLNIPRAAERFWDFFTAPPRTS